MTTFDFNLKRNIFLDYFYSALIICLFPVNVLYKSILTLIPFLIVILSVLSLFDFLYNGYSFSNQNYIFAFVLIGLGFSTPLSRLFSYLDICIESIWKNYHWTDEDKVRFNFSETFLQLDKELEEAERNNYLYKNIKFHLTNFHNINLSNLNKHLKDEYEEFSTKICFFASFPIFLLLKLNALINT